MKYEMDNRDSITTDLNIKIEVNPVELFQNVLENLDCSEHIISTQIAKHYSREGTWWLTILIQVHNLQDELVDDVSIRVPLTNEPRILTAQ